MSATGGLGVQSKEQEAERKDKNDRRNQWRTSEAHLHICMDFESGPVVKNRPSSLRDMGSIPAWGTKIPHASGQNKLQLLNLLAKSKHHNEDAVQHPSK